MADANEREWLKVERAVLLTRLILERGSISFAEARREVGGSRYQVYRLLRAMERALPMYREAGRRVLLRKKD